MAQLQRRLGPFTAALVVVASMIGVGVFTTTGFLVRDLQSLPAVLVAWLLGGLVALSGAIAYAELTAALPNNGGEYQLLTRIYHPAVGFTAGVISVIVGFAAPIAAAALAFGHYLERVVPGVAPKVAAALLIALMSLLHMLRVSAGSRLQNLLTLANTLLVVGLIVLGLSAGHPELLQQTSRITTAEAVMSPSFAVGVVYVSFAYLGWNAAIYLAGEINEPARNLPLALLLGTAVVTLLYLGLNLAFLLAVPMEQLAGVVEVAHVAARGLFGEHAARLVSATIALGLAATVGASILTGSRVFEAMGRDYPRLNALALRTEHSGPITGVGVQAVLALAMVFASFDSLLTYMGFTLLASSALCVAGVFWFRKREPQVQRPYRAWGHPWTTLLALLLMLWMIAHTLIERPLSALAGAITILLGWGLYALVK